MYDEKTDKRTLESTVDFETMTEKFVQEYSEIIEEVIEQKIVDLSYEALKLGENKLYEILYEIEKGNVNQGTVEEFRERLNEHGYFLSIDIPQADITIEDNIYRSTLDSEKIKVRVYKEIATA